MSKATRSGHNAAACTEAREDGFSLLECVFAMVIIMIALLGVVHSITYAIIYNAGNATRSQTVAILQQEVEMLRAAKFTPQATDSYAPTGTVCRTDGLRDITGGKKTACTLAAPNGGQFLVTTWVDDDPFTVNAADTPDINANTTFKEITVRVQLATPSPGWQNSVVVESVLRRTKGN